MASGLNGQHTLLTGVSSTSILVMTVPGITMAPMNRPLRLSWARNSEAAARMRLRSWRRRAGVSYRAELGGRRTHAVGALQLPDEEAGIGGGDAQGFVDEDLELVHAWCGGGGL